jgi:hypothetical protein
MYLYSSGLGEQGKKSLEKRNIVYTKDGVRVGVKDKTDEQINDKVQRYASQAKAQCRQTPLRANVSFS